MIRTQAPSRHIRDVTCNNLHPILQQLHYESKKETKTKPRERRGQWTARKTTDGTAVNRREGEDRES